MPILSTPKAAAHENSERSESLHRNRNEDARRSSARHSSGPGRGLPGLRLAQQGSVVVELSVVGAVAPPVATTFTAAAAGAEVAMFEGVVVAAMCIETTRGRDNS